MDASTATGIGATIAAVIGGAYGYWQKLKATKANEIAVTATEQAQKTANADLASSQSELMTSFKEMANDWKGRYEIEHDENRKYREYVHEKSKKDQETMLRLTEENADLRARTDLTPIMDQLKAQSKVNEQLGETLGKLTEAVTILLDRLSPHEPNPL